MEALRGAATPFPFQFFCVIGDNERLLLMFPFVQVILVTTVGEIEIELWCKETPLACRNFIQLCMEGYYNGCIFHRWVSVLFQKTTLSPTPPRSEGD